MIKGYLSKPLIILIKAYKKFISPLKKPCCRYYPCCSDYAIEALRRHGAFKGSVLALWRLLRCNPYSGGGVDYVPKRFHIYTLRSEEKRRRKSDGIN